MNNIRTDDEPPLSLDAEITITMTGAEIRALMVIINLVLHQDIQHYIKLSDLNLLGSLITKLGTKAVTARHLQNHKGIRN